jgi:hypothetical protein
MSSKTAWDIMGAAAAGMSLLNVFGPEQQGAQGRYNSFISNIRKDGVAKTNRFLVVITPPRMLLRANAKAGAMQERLTLLCDGTSLPMLAISMATPVRRYGVGPTDEHATGSIVTQQPFRFIGDGKGYVYKFFYNWLQGMVKSDRLPSETTSRAGFTGLAAYEVEYKEEYATTIDIFTYDEMDNKVIHVKLYDAFPQSLADVNLGWGDEGIMQITVPMSFRHWELHNIDEEFMDREGFSNDLSTIQKIVKGATIVQTIAAIRKPQSVGDYISIANNAKTVINNIGGLF